MDQRKIFFSSEFASFEIYKIFLYVGIHKKCQSQQHEQDEEKNGGNF